MNWLQAIVLSLVEGVTEFLPISSTAHLMFTANLLGLEHTDFLKSFEIAIQLGAILSVAVLYAQKLIKNPSLIWKIMMAFVPTGIIGIGLYPFVKSFLIGNDWVAIAALLIGGLLIVKLPVISDQLHNKLSIKELSVKKLLYIGLWQSVAVVPGVSRALATIWGGQMVGLSRVEAVEMSFLLAMPTMAAATGYDLVKTGMSFTSSEWSVLGIGFIGAFVSALIVVKWLIGFVQKHDLKVFGWYRVVLALGWGGLLIVFQ